MASTPSTLRVQGTALPTYAQGSMKTTAKKFIGAVEDEWQLFRFGPSVSAKTLRFSDAL